MAKTETRLISGDGHARVKRASVVESVSRSLEILVCLGSGMNTITEIAYDCHINNSTVHRLLQTLEESRAVIQDPISHRYFLGPLIPGLAANLNATHQRLILCANEEMKRLADYTQETLTLGLLSGLTHFLLDSIPCRQRLRVVDPEEQGYIDDLYTAATGQVLLSQLPAKALKTTFNYIKLNSTKIPGAAIEDMMLKIEKVRQQGYAFTVGERVPGAMCISVPISNYVLPVCLNVLGPSSRLKPITKNVVEMAVKSGSRISQKLKDVYSI